MTIGFGAVLISTVVAVVVGVTSGYFGGWIDLLVQRVVDIWISFPALVLLVSLVAIVGPGLVEHDAGAGHPARTGHGPRGAQRGAGRCAISPTSSRRAALGAGDLRIVRATSCPTCRRQSWSLATTQLGVAVLAESTLDFLGYGVPPPFPRGDRC